MLGRFVASLGTKESRKQFHFEYADLYSSLADGHLNQRGYGQVQNVPQDHREKHETPSLSSRHHLEEVVAA